MKPPVRRRPCWVVLASGTTAAIEKIVFANDDDDAERTLEVRVGTSDYVAIIEYAPGSECSGEEELARTLSTIKPAYVLWLNEESPRVQAFEHGAYAGDVRAWPDAVARHVGCSFPQMTSDGAERVDLTPRKAPVAAPGELTVGQWTIAQWKHVMTQPEWSVLLDGASEETAANALAALTHADPQVRAVACKLVEVIGVRGYRDRASHVVAILRFARGDRRRRRRSRGSRGRC